MLFELTASHFRSGSKTIPIILNPMNILSKELRQRNRAGLKIGLRFLTGVNLKCSLICSLASVVGYNKISNGCAEVTPTRIEAQKRQSGKKVSLIKFF